MLAVRLAVAAGDRVEVISPRQRLTPMGPLPVRARVVIEAVHAPESGHEGGSLTLPLAAAQRILWGEPVVEAIELTDPGDPWGLGRRVRSALGERTAELRVDGLDEIHRPLLLALTLERVMIFAAVALMLVVAALNLLCNVAMVAAEKRRDLAVLAGLGLEPARLRRLFLLLGLGIGSAAAVLGATAGAALAIVLDAQEIAPAAARRLRGRVGAVSGRTRHGRCGRRAGAGSRDAGLVVAGEGCGPPRAGRRAPL